MFSIRLLHKMYNIVWVFFIVAINNTVIICTVVGLPIKYIVSNKWFVHSNLNANLYSY